MGRSPCCDKNTLKKGPWTPEEDAKLTHHIQMHGPGNWRTLPKIAGLERCGKSCRLRWTNYLRPDIKRGRFSFEEEETIIQLHSVLGNKWSAIAARLPGRTDNEIKNYWNTHIRKRLLRMGIDPVTHAPRLDLLDLSSLLVNSPQLNNLSNLICLQTIMNPEALRVALTLISPQNENQLLNYQNQHQHQFQNQAPSVIQPNQSSFDNIITQQIPSNNPTTSSFNNQSQSLQGDYLSSSPHFPVGPTNSTYQLLFQDNNCATINNAHNNNNNASTNDQSLDTYLPICHGISDQMKVDLSSSSPSENFGFDSVLSSTPLSSPAPPNTTSSAVGLTINGTTEDERESFCSNLLRFEIPEGFDYFDDFM
ncbi:hypothetical protein ABFS82_13G023300 [Erythranthe guttata]|uniref:transcription factor MYB39-like n=1 Tax=Erythranthe guttata TaxID=4155 RepID=UPI00064DBD77|nr:PREDICTED: transcription factor MYB39-like [Erythranthe guttata]|eukprot:XP_012852371.1 PREDICTED: transcription factor MYB39-like [Erythranthe guttata]